MKKIFIVLLVITFILTGCQKAQYLPDDKLTYEGDIANGKRNGTVRCFMKIATSFMKVNGRMEIFRRRKTIYEDELCVMKDSGIKTRCMEKEMVYSEAGDLIL
jgi:hypothetical protein